MAVFTRREPDVAARLILWRHAKSAYPLGVRDIDRPLADRGVRDAIATRQHLQGLCAGYRTRVLVSAARRTLETWAWAGCGVAGHAVDGCDVEVRSDLYLATRDRLIEEITLQSDDVDAVVLLAHDPGLHELVLDLAGASTRADGVRSKFPTSAVAVFDVNGTWHHVDRDAVLRDVIVPRG